MPLPAAAGNNLPSQRRFRVSGTPGPARLTPGFALPIALLVHDVHGVANDATVPIDDLFARARTAVSTEDRNECHREIELWLAKATRPVERGRLLMCRARVHSDQWRTAQVLDDALEAMRLFEGAGAEELALDATSLAAAFASRSGELSLAAELATKAIVSPGAGTGDALAADVANRLGIFCYSFLAYERAIDQFEVALAAARRSKDLPKVYRQLHNVADAALLAMRATNVPGSEAAALRTDPKMLERARGAVARLVEEVPPDVRRGFGSQRLEAELLLELGRCTEAMELIRSAPDDGAVVAYAQRAALAMVESRGLRMLGRGRDAVVAADRAVQLAASSGDDHELMLALEERLAARRAAGDTEGALADALEVKWKMWVIHKSRTAQLVEQVWRRAAVERQRRELEATTAAAMRTAEEDPLMRIGNRRLLERFLLAASDSSRRLALIIADIDHFKEINDAFGHELGDRVLRALGELFTQELRPGQVVARYGGEEFVFVLPGAEPEAAGGFADRLRQRVESHPWVSVSPSLAVTISFGVASGPSTAWRSVMIAADSALYVAKRLGRNRVEVATHSLEPFSA